MKVSKNFIIQEFVDKDTYTAFGNNSIWFIDPKLIKIAQELRSVFGPVTINNWKWDGDRHWSGLRTNKSSYYSRYSQHSFGRAADMVFKNISAEDVRNAIKVNESYWTSLGIGGIEEDVSWLHVDTRNNKNIRWFNA